MAGAAAVSAVVGTAAVGAAVVRAVAAVVVAVRAAEVARAAEVVLAVVPEPGPERVPGLVLEPVRALGRAPEPEREQAVRAPEPEWVLA